MIKKRLCISMCVTVVWLLAGCGPRILSYDIGPAGTVGLNQPVKLSWKVRGKATLLISDAKYDELDTARLMPLTLAVTGKDGRRTLRLSPGIADTLHLESEGMLEVVKVQDGVTDARLRTFALVATNKDNAHPDFRRPAIAILPDSAASEIGLRRNGVKGDSLVASGMNNPLRWGKFLVLSVSNRGDRPLTISHSGIMRMLLPGATPDYSFQGTPVKGPWEFRAPKTEAERADPRLYAPFFKIAITVKPN